MICCGVLRRKHGLALFCLRCGRPLNSPICGPLPLSSQHYALQQFRLYGPLVHQGVGYSGLVYCKLTPSPFFVPSNEFSYHRLANSHTAFDGSAFYEDATLLNTRICSPFPFIPSDFDWSNSKAIWATSKPMNDEELLFQQVQMTTSASPDTTVWVYRCSVYAYPWYTSVRTILDDPAYSDWFIKFKPGLEHPINPPCDNNYNPPKCSNYFHMQEQTPGYPSGDGTCAAPACDCGTVPCGALAAGMIRTVWIPVTR